MSERQGGMQVQVDTY